MEWHQLDMAELCSRLGTSSAGLSSSEARQRLLRHGPNALQEKKKRSAFSLFISQFNDFMILVLIGAAVVAGAISETIDSVVILAIVVLNAVIGFVQEYRAERAMAALKELAAPQAVALRDGSPCVIPAAELVPGDVVLLEAGDILPADLRLMEAVRFQVVEAALTGESLPAHKEAASYPQRELPLGDRKNMAFKGTVATNGRGKGIVVATGMGTELGKIAAMLQEQEEQETPLQRRLAVFGRRLCFAILALCLIFFAAGVMRGEDTVVMLLTAISLAVAAIPEALPALVSVSLALGARKLAAEKALARSLSAVETLGSVTHICTDKTGTLTMNRMVVEKVYAGGRLFSLKDLTPSSAPDEAMLWAAMALCHEVRETEAGEVAGDPTEVALVSAARQHAPEVQGIAARHPKLAEIPFDPQRKLMTTLHPWEGGFVSFTKGAPEVVLRRCGAAAGGAGEGVAGAAAAVAPMADEGMRVLALAMRRWEKVPEQPDEEVLEQELTLLGLAGIVDPPREEAAQAVALCLSAGITPVMITGDHPQTAQSIARRLGIMQQDSGALITGEALSALSMEDFQERVARLRVYARCAPEQKLKIVKALQDRGELVAMTGDGVNDAPALKRADIGVAMGVTGTEVAKESADLILLDDNFATIVKAVREGRRIYDNMRKFIKYLLTTNTGEIVAIAAAPLLGLPMPLLPVQILWLNLVTDALPALALSLEPAEENLMTRPPRPPEESIFARGLGTHVVLVGVFIGLLVLGVQAWSLRAADPHWQTLTLTVLCFTQFFQVLAIRSERQSLFSIGICSNLPLLAAILLSLALQLGIIYLPAMNRIFHTKPLELRELVLAVAVSSLVFLVIELEKLVRRWRARRRCLAQ